MLSDSQTWTVVFNGMKVTCYVNGQLTITAGYNGDKAANNVDSEPFTVV